MDDVMSEKKRNMWKWGWEICYVLLHGSLFMLPSHSITPFKLHMYKIHVGSIA